MREPGTDLQPCGKLHCAASGHCSESVCSVQWMARQFGDKWSLSIVCRLSAGPLRFSQLKASLHGISQRMLTRTLKKLEAIGVITRTASTTVPVQVTYALTERGEALLDPVQKLHKWMASFSPEHLAAFSQVFPERAEE